MKAVFLSEQPERLKRVYDGAVANALLTEAGLDTQIYSKKDLAESPKRFQKVEYIFSSWGMPELTEKEIEQYFPKLKCVFYAAGSVQSFAKPFLKRGVRVFSAWAANAVPVAEFTAAQIVLANKGYYRMNRLYQEDGYIQAQKVLEKYSGNYDETVGVLGAGMVGKLVIERLHSYSLKILVFDPFLPEKEAEALGVMKCELRQVFEQSAVVSNHLADNTLTRNMLGYDCFSRMRENAVLINTGRGAQIVEVDLIRVLQERPDLTALLDVTAPEPVESGHPFLALKNCVLTPHIAGSVGNEYHRLAECMLEGFRTACGGGKCRYEVKEEMLKTMA